MQIDEKPHGYLFLFDYFIANRHVHQSLYIRLGFLPSIGTILARRLRGEEIEKKLEEIFE